ncbi:MAG: hypothetical protein AB1730_14270, partial [Myxococcota bacterium]
ASRSGTATDAADVTAVAATESANRRALTATDSDKRPGASAPEPASRSGTATDAADVTAIAATESANRRALTATDSDKRPGASAPDSLDRGRLAATAPSAAAPVNDGPRGGAASATAPAEPPGSTPLPGAPLGLSAPVEDRPAERPTPLSIDLALLGGAALDGSALGVGTGALLVRGAVGRWGLTLDVGLESARTASREGVTVLAAQQWLSFCLSVAFQPTESLRLDLALGLRAWRLAAIASGVDQPNEGVSFLWGGAVGAGLAWRLTGPFFLTARASATLRNAVLRLNVAPLDTILALNPWNVGLQGGLLVRFE